MPAFSLCISISWGLPFHRRIGIMQSSYIEIFRMIRNPIQLRCSALLLFYLLSELQCLL